jgi:hypothetical protein
MSQVVFRIKNCTARQIDDIMRKYPSAEIVENEILKSKEREGPTFQSLHLEERPGYIQ